MARHPFTIIHARRIREHLRAIERKHHNLILDAIAEQLQFEPDLETRNRKRLKRPGPFGANWELRFGPDNCFRVLYGLDPENRQVEVLAVGRKVRNRLFIGGKEEKP